MKRSPIKRSNPARKRKQFAIAFGSRERVEWVQSIPCIVCGDWPSECAHVRSRAAGGTWRDVVPLCRVCHREQHQMGIASFEELNRVDLAAKAEEFAGRGPQPEDE